MTQPTKPSIPTDFSDDEANGVAGRSSVRTALLDAAIGNLKTAIDAIIDNLALVQRDDTALLDGVVRMHTLSSEVLALLGSTSWVIRGSWVTTTAYAKGDIVLQSGVLYLCLSTHTAGTFATDIANALWGQITASGAASATSFAPTSTIAATNVQTAIQELDSETRPVQSMFVRDFFNGL